MSRYARWGWDAKRLAEREREEDERLIGAAKARGVAPHYGQRDAGGPPPGWQPGAAEARLVTSTSSAPRSYDAKARTVEAVLATGYRVRRWFGWEELAIRDDAIDLRRVALGQCRLLDSHNQSTTGAALGTIIEARVERGELVGTVRFHDTPKGREAERQVAAGELTGVSVGYRVTKLVRIDDVGADDEVYVADAWELLEASLVSVPADPLSGVRGLFLAQCSFGARLSPTDAARLRMALAQRLVEQTSSAVEIAREILRTEQIRSPK